jgi:hypothetical protein
VSSRASDARRSLLLPSARAPAIVHARGRSADALDALLTIVTLPAAAGAFERLPQGARCRELQGRPAPKSGTVGKTVLAWSPPSRCWAT